jgi:hypothetical protein
MGTRKKLTNLTSDQSETIDTQTPYIPVVLEKVVDRYFTTQVRNFWKLIEHQ